MDALTNLFKPIDLKLDFNQTKAFPTDNQHSPYTKTHPKNQKANESEMPYSKQNVLFLAYIDCVKHKRTNFFRSADWGLVFLAKMKLLIFWVKKPNSLILWLC